MIIIFKASDITEAHIVAGLLQANGIETYVGGHYQQGGVGELAPFDYARVHINEKDAERARKIVAEYQGEHHDALQEQGPEYSRFSTDLVVVLFVLFVAVSLFFLMFR